MHREVGIIMSNETKKIKIKPIWCNCFQNIEENNACAEIELPGVKKEDIKLKMTDEGFSLSAPKEDMEYEGAWTWCCPVDSSKAKAKYDNGFLRVEAPVKTGPPVKEVKIE